MVLHVLGDLSDGVFVEIGACDAFELSNTYLLEKRFGWRGIVAEPGRCWHAALAAARDCYVSTKFVAAASNGRVMFNETKDPVCSTIDLYSGIDSHAGLREGGQIYEVETIAIGDLLASGGAARHIHHMSIDTEGSELDILRAIDFDRHHIDILTVEHNRTDAREQIFDYLTACGYTRKYEGFSQRDACYFKVVPTIPLG